jgi:hypothetical protein
MSTSIYHITHIANLPNIIESGGLIANSRLRQENIEYVNIAYEHIQRRRGMTHIPCGAGGYLHDYVPFYFAPRSPMLYAIHKNRIDSYSGGQTQILHLVSHAEAVALEGLSYVFTDGHAAMQYTRFCNEFEYLYADGLIDWEIMAEQYWRDTEEDGDRKRRRQAEFLVHRFFPWQLIHEIGVINTTIQTEVKEILQKLNIQIPVNVYSRWYY